MITDHIKQQISAYIDGELNGQERVDIENLLATNEACRNYHAELVNMRHLFTTVSNQPLSLDAQLSIEKNITKEKPMKSSQLRPVVAVCAVVCVALLSFQLVFKKQAMYQQKWVKSTFFVETESKPNLGSKESQSPGSNSTIIQDKSPVAAKKMETKEGASLANNKVMLMQADELEGAGLAITRRMDTVSYEKEYDNSRGGQIVLSKSYNRIRGVSVDNQLISANTEQYNLIKDNSFLIATDNPLSTFSIDVDTASYSNMRRFLMSNQMPPKDAVRIEEMINYFNYQYPQPKDDKPFSVTTDLAICPWNKAHQLLRIGLKGKVPQQPADLPASNLVFLIDVSGSMSDPNKLSLVQQGLKMMVNHLRDKDQVAIVTYAGNAGTVLEPTHGDQKTIINAAIDQLTSGGSTAGAAGIQQAYELAKKHFIKDGNNRVVLATDGDFNVGVSSVSELIRLIEEKRQDHIFLTVLGVGEGNLKDSTMESLADHGNGNYYYLDTLNEARKVLVDELGSTIFTIAKDVKIQIEFNPKFVSSYRLVGYENRMLAKEDFNNDAKDAGEIGAGHTVTALYEIVPANVKESVPSSDPLKYQQNQVIDSQDLLTVKLRYKQPDGDVSQLMTAVVNAQQANHLQEPTGDFAWAASVAEFGMILRDSEFKKDASIDHVLNVIKGLLNNDSTGMRQEFVSLVEKAKTIMPTTKAGVMGFKE